jgi:hypothetical protein
MAVKDGVMGSSATRGEANDWERVVIGELMSGLRRDRALCKEIGVLDDSSIEWRFLVVVEEDAAASGVW